jgi:hypothetical protein
LLGAVFPGKSSLISGRSSIFQAANQAVFQANKLFFPGKSSLISGRSSIFQAANQAVFQAKSSLMQAKSSQIAGQSRCWDTLKRVSPHKIFKNVSLKGIFIF